VAGQVDLVIAGGSAIMNARLGGAPVKIPVYSPCQSRESDEKVPRSVGVGQRDAEHNRADLDEGVIDVSRGR
jgi:hypothetical protein